MLNLSLLILSGLIILRNLLVELLHTVELLLKAPCLNFLPQLGYLPVPSEEAGSAVRHRGRGMKVVPVPLLPHHLVMSAEISIRAGLPIAMSVTS